MDSNDNEAPNTCGKECVARVGAFARRRNPLPDEPPDNDNVAFATAASVPLHVQQQNASDNEESPINHHQLLEQAATLRSYKNTKILLTSLVEVVPRGTLTLVR